MFVQPYGLVWASFLLFLGAMVSLLLELRLARSLVWSAFRALFQLLALGMVLSFLFRANSIPLTFAVIVLMTFLATHAISGRISNLRYPGIFLHSFVSLVVGGWLFSFIAGQLILLPGSWRKPEVILPFAGLLMGNSLSGISLGLRYWMTHLSNQRDLIETRLAHGASSWEAIHPLFCEAITTAMTPTLNAMAVAGVVSLPGMMTGQLLAGADPKVAVHYQIAALFLIAASTFFGTLSALGWGYRTLFNSHHQLEFQKLEDLKHQKVAGHGTA